MHVRFSACLCLIPLVSCNSENLGMYSRGGRNKEETYRRDDEIADAQDDSVGLFWLSIFFTVFCAERHLKERS